MSQSDEPLFFCCKACGKVIEDLDPTRFAPLWMQKTTGQIVSKSGRTGGKAHYEYLGFGSREPFHYCHGFSKYLATHVERRTLSEIIAATAVELDTS